jgi:hypothetical protein
MGRLPGVIAVATVFIGQGAGAQSGTEFSYAVKFVCGTFDAGAGALAPVVPGTYLTAISVFNPNDESVDLTYDVAFTLGSIAFPKAEERLEAMEARRLDCDSLFDGEEMFLKGILYIVAEARLDVWAVYTAEELGAGDQISIDAEQVLGRRLEGRTAGKLVE